MIYDLIIVGGGPAGISAGIYASRQGLDVLLIAKNFGGQVARKAVDIENYPGFEKISGIDLFNKFEKHLKSQKLEILTDKVVTAVKEGDIFTVSCEENKDELKAKALIVTSGADPRPLEVPGEKEFIGKGVSYCSVCDGPLFKGKTVAVIGGGNSGFEAALFLSQIAKKIYILERSAGIAADERNQEAVRKTGKVEVIAEAALEEIQGDKFVNSVIYEDLKTLPAGRQDKKEISLAVEGVFVEIGSIPATSFVKNLVDFNEKDEIKVDPFTCQTKTPGLFAAGDITDVMYKQIVIAAGQGTIAALSAYKYLQGK